MSQGAAAAGERPFRRERPFGHRGNVCFLLKLNPKLVSDHPESGRSETQLGIECLGRCALVASLRWVGYGVTSEGQCSNIQKHKGRHGGWVVVLG